MIQILTEAKHAKLASIDERKRVWHVQGKIRVDANSAWSNTFAFHFPAQYRMPTDTKLANEGFNKLQTLAEIREFWNAITLQTEFWQLGETPREWDLYLETEDHGVALKVLMMNDSCHDNVNSLASIGGPDWSYSGDALVFHYNFLPVVTSLSDSNKLMEILESK